MEFLFIWIVMAIICAMVAHSRGRSAVGFFFYGLLIWPIALVHALLSKRPRPAARAELQITVTPPPPPPPPAAPFPGRAGDTKRCPICAEDVRAAAIKCRFCGHDFPPEPPPPPRPTPIPFGMRRCTTCNALMFHDAKACPACHADAPLAPLAAAAATPPTRIHWGRDEEPESPPPPPSRRKWWILGAAALALIVAVAYWPRPPAGPGPSAPAQPAFSTPPPKLSPTQILLIATNLGTLQNCGGAGIEVNRRAEDTARASGQLGPYTSRFGEAWDEARNAPPSQCDAARRLLPTIENLMR